MHWHMRKSDVVRGVGGDSAPVAYTPAALRPLTPDLHYHDFPFFAMLQFVLPCRQFVVVDFFVEELDLQRLGFARSAPARTGRPGYHPAVLLKLFIYGYLNRIPSSRRLEREAGRNVEVMWLLGKLVPDHKTIADFRRDNGAGIRNVCRRFVVLCRDLKLFSQAVVAIDGSRFKAVNSRERTSTPTRSRPSISSNSLPADNTTPLPM